MKASSPSYELCLSEDKPARQNDYAYEIQRDEIPISEREPESPQANRLTIMHITFCGIVALNKG